VSLASLPHRIPFKLGGLVRPAETGARGFTGVLPKRLPFTLSARSVDSEVAYGSVGWELICRSHSDFQTELLRTTDMTSLTFTKELNAYGMASFGLNLNHPLFQQSLNDGSPIETLFDYENLWEIRFDGDVVFQFLGTASTDSQINDTETLSATISGAGIGKVLEWATVFPSGFPDRIVTKLETAVDAFGSELDQLVWTRTSLDPNITVQAEGGRREAEADRDKYQQERTGLTEQKTSATNSYNSEKQSYDQVMKQKNPAATAAEKKEALKQLNEAKAELDKVNTALDVNQKNLTQATQRMTFFGAVTSDETAGHAKLVVSSGQPTKYITSRTYDFESSGLSVAVEPGPSLASGTGQVSTIVKLIHDPGQFTNSSSNYARMYTQRINGNLRIVAEVSNGSSVANEEWAYDVTSQKYWRIREDSGEVVFDTSADNTVWTERFRTAYVWPSTHVVLQLGLELIGNVGIAAPLPAYFYNLNKSTIPSTETAMQLFKKYLSESQARGVIPYVKTTFTDAEDSRGLPWTGKLGVDVAEGTRLDAVLASLAQVQQADWIMDTDFNLNVYQRSKTDEAIPPAFFSKQDVVFHETGSQISKERNRSRDTIANAIVGKNQSGSYVYTEDKESMAKYQKREAFISAGNATDLDDLTQVLNSSLEDLKDEKVSWRVSVAANQEGRRVFKDYDVGDWISIENIDSNHNVSIGQWRVVGIAVNVASDATQTVELTLQSRRELLIERLKQQVANLSASSASGGTTLGSAISAITLIEQVTLAGLRDVVVSSAVEGDVLTFSRGYWIPQAPGDKTIPETPNLTSVYSNVYYPSDGVSVRAQADISWELPYNTDGSYITDGHHYELRYKPSVTADLQSSWETVEGEAAWSDLLTWAQPVLPPITNAGWQTVYVAWGQLNTVIQELTPGVTYDLQIRAVDSSTPQHFSEWSDSFSFTAQTDTIAPPKPAPPVIASSMVAIQVQHFLGKAEGGTFNLPPDMAYLEVHVGDANFYPNETTRVGKILADAGMLRSGTPVIQTFNVDSTENIYVRVIAIDTAGNRSAPSNAVTATVNLIDDAHISDLTASKITAGTISASIILGGVIKTGESGARAEMNFEGFRIYSEDEDPTVSLLGNPGVNGNFLLIKDLEDPTITLAGIDGTGRGSFQDISITNDINIGGDSLKSDIIDPMGKGVISIGYYPGASIVGAAAGNERGFLEISFIAEESRTYMICAVTEWESTAANDRLVMRLRDAGEISPTLDMPWIQQSISVGAAAAGGNAAAHITYAGTFTPGLHRILWSIQGGAGTPTVNAQGNTGVESTTLIWVEDVGLPKTDTVIINDAGVSPAGTPAPTIDTPRAVAPKPKIEYTKNYAATWSGTYRSNGDYSSSHGSTMVQGNSGADNWLNDARALCGFDYAKILADTKDATIKACYITMYANHWYWNDGGTARIGTHNYTGRPSTWSSSRVDEQRVTSSNWPKPGKRKVSLGVAVGQDFQSGAAKGIALGPTDGTKTQYGKFNGNGQSNEPVLTIVYVK